MGARKNDAAPWPEAPGVVVPDDITENLLKRQIWRVSLPVRSTEQMSLWHSSCNHRTYNLSCEQFETLLVKSQFRCQVCGRKNVKLHIDHDHSIGWWGVRGLLCQTCNSRLGHIELGRTPTDERFERFLANPYPDRRPPLVVPVLPLRSLLISEIQACERSDAREEGLRQSVAGLDMDAAARRTRKYREWRTEWTTRDYPSRLYAVWHALHAAAPTQP